MKIKAKDLVWERWGSLSYTITFDGNELKCHIMLGDIQIGEGDRDQIPDDVYKVAKEFGFMLQNKIKQIIQNRISIYEDATIYPIKSKKHKSKKYNSFVSHKVNWLVNNDSLRLVV